VRWRTILVVAVALLAILSMPASAQNASAVASEHTSFGTSSGEPSPTKTQNMTVEGSGESASVALQTGGLIDSFEDQDLDEYSGDTGRFSFTDSTGVTDGSYALTSSSDSTERIYSTSGLPSYPSAGGVNLTADVTTGPDTKLGGGVTFGVQDSDNYYEVIFIGDGFNELRITKVEDGSGTTLDSASFAPSADTTYELDISWTEDSDGDVSIIATIRDTNGNGLQTVSGADTNAPLTSGGIGVSVTNMGGNPIYVDDYRQGSGQSYDQGTYVGATHEAEEIETGFADLELQNASADVTWQEDADDDGTWSNVTSSTYTSSSNVTANLSGTQSDRWRLRVDVEKTGPGAVAEIHDEGLLFEPSAPTISNSDPADGSKVSDYDGDISINVSDRDLGLAQGDTIVVEAEDADGEQIGQQTVSSNGTVTFSYDALAGSNSIEWTATDEYGSSDTRTQNFTTPDQLTVYRESENSTTITNATVTIRFYPVGDDEGQVVTRSTTDATINMSGLPGDQPFVAVANVSGYESRRIFIRSLFEQQRMYLLNDSVDSAETIFQVRDYTGRFPPDNTVLEIRRPVNGSWKTISGDYFGASAQYPATLEVGARYRLRLYNPETGATRPLGTYQPIVAQTQTIEVSPESGIDDLGGLPVASIGPQTRRVPALNDSQITAQLSEGQNATVEFWRVTVTANGTELVNETYPADTREASITADLGPYAGEQVDVRVVSTLEDGETVLSGTATLQAYDSPTHDLALLALITDFVGLAAPGTAGALTSFLATAVTIFVMAGLSTQLAVSGETTALVGVLTLAGFSVVGWIGYDVVFVAGASVVALAALRRGL
jgi:hypothetical protein